MRGGPIGAGTNRVLCVGDSFTFGWLLDETNTFVYKLDQFAARDFPVGTLAFLIGGVDGWGTADYVAFVEDFGAKIHPSAIVVFLNNDDVERSVRSGLFRLDTKNADWVTPTKPNVPGAGFRDIFRSFGLYQWTLEHSQLIQFFRVAVRAELNQTRRKTPINHPTDTDPEPGVRLAEALFLRLRQWRLDHDCRLFVVTTDFQAFPDYPLGRAEGAANKKFSDKAPQFLPQTGLPFTTSDRKCSGSRKVIIPGW